MRNKKCKYSLNNPYCQTTMSYIIVTNYSVQEPFKHIYNRMQFLETTFTTVVNLLFSNQLAQFYIRLYDKEFAKQITRYNKKVKERLSRKEK